MRHAGQTIQSTHAGIRCEPGTTGRWEAGRMGALRGDDGRAAWPAGRDHGSGHRRYGAGGTTGVSQRWPRARWRTFRSSWKIWPTRKSWSRAGWRT